MKIKTYEDEILPVMIEHNLITEEEKDTFSDYIKNSYFTEEA